MFEAISLLHSASICSIGMHKHMCHKSTHSTDTQRTHAAVNLYTLTSNCQRQEACSKQLRLLVAAANSEMK